jgi:hypothetical protein
MSKPILKNNFHSLKQIKEISCQSKIKINFKIDFFYKIVLKEISAYFVVKILFLIQFCSIKKIARNIQNINFYIHLPSC